jgi:AraC-like DNA-binding protein
MVYRIDLFAIFIFLGIVQAAFLSFFFLSKENRKLSYNIFHGLLLICLSLCLVEILLMYTGYIAHTLYLVDFSEPFALLIGPMLYFFVHSLTQEKVKSRTIWIHTAFPIIYTLAFVPFLIAPTDVKYNAWINAYHPDMPLRAWNLDYDPWMFGLTEWHTELVLISLATYITISAMEIVKSFHTRGERFWKPIHPSLRILRNRTLGMAAFLLSLLLVKILYKHDPGDHVMAAFGSLLIYINSISVIRSSGFFKQPSLTEAPKYKSSSLTDDQLRQGTARLREILNEQKLFIQPSFSLPELAQFMNVSVHTMSQIINDGMGKSFFELMAEYRIEEAKKKLLDHPNIKIEEIAEQVGYNSKSSFNTAFKKITGKTPSEFRSRI